MSVQSTKICSFEGCGRQSRSGGLCNTHYEQKRQGKPLTVFRPWLKGSLPTIGFEEVPCVCGGLDGPCHIPSIGINADGYRRTVVRKKSTYVHHIVWQQANGPIPAGLVVVQRCRNRACCSLEHLRLIEPKVLAIETAAELPNVTGVKFATIDRYLGYAFGDDGSVWSKRMKGLFVLPDGTPRLRNDWKKLTVSLRMNRSVHPYAHVTLRATTEAESMTREVHPLILEAFVGPRPDGLQCCHNNGVGSDNRLLNLRRGTPKSNWADRIEHGTDSRGSRHPRAKFNEADVIRMRQLRDSGTSTKELAAIFSASRAACYRVCSRRSWKHVA